MAIIRSDLALPTLRILIAPPRGITTEALFQVVPGGDTPMDVARCSLDELGLPDTLTGLDPIDDGKLKIPPSVLRALNDAAETKLGPSPLPPYNALWLEFPSPRGFLYVMPWERLLVSLGRTLFRLPYHLVRPKTSRRALDVAICTSTPRAKERFLTPEVLEALTRRYYDLFGRDVTVHIFTDAEWFESVSHRLEYFPRVIVHNPDYAADYEMPDRSARVGSTAQISSPWLLWMRDSLQRKPIDFVHFVSHGYMSGDQGAIAMAMSPTVNADRRLSRFIGSVELNTFLSQIGAWGLVLTGPYNNYSDVGLRELADAIALIRPGITITHDWESDTGGRQLAEVLQFILSPQPEHGNEVWPAVTCWAHPRFVEFAVRDRQDLHLNADGSSAFIADATRQALTDEDAETWVASATRALESQQVRWLPDSTDSPTDEAAVTALRNMADLVERHVERSHPRRTGGWPT